jgi:DNA-binding transcriptional LysR family regulator
MDQLDLHHLRCVVTLAEELNFGRAAVRLHMSQPPLSRLVSEVEREVGARLFQRTTRRVTLTPVGEVFVVEARAVLARAELALESVRAAVRRQTGKLRVAYTWFAFNTVLPQLLTRLREQDHDVSVDLVDLATEAQREALANGHADLGFVDEPIALEGFESVRLVERPLTVLLHAGHPLATGDRVPFGALAGETLILHARHECPRHYDHLLAACRHAGFTPHVHHREARQNCIALVATGQGVLLTPAPSYPQLPEGLRCLPLEDAPAHLRAEVWAVVPVAPVSPTLTALRELIRAFSLPEPASR